MQTTHRARGYLAAISGTAFWSTTAIFVGYLNARYQLPPLVLAFWRDLLVAAGLWVGLRLLSPPQLVLPGGRTHLPFLVTYGFTLATFNALWITSVVLNGAAVATVLVYTAPAFTALLAWRLFGEPLGTAKLVAIGLSIAGCALVSEAYRADAWQANPLGIGIGLLAGLGFAAYSLFGKAGSRRGLPSWTTTLYTFAFGALFLLLLQRPDTLFGLGTSAAGWGVLIFLAIVPTIGGYGLYTASLAHLPASTASLITSLEPPMTAGLAFLVLKETMTGEQLAGSALILLSVLLVQAGERAALAPMASRSSSGRPPTTHPAGK